MKTSIKFCTPLWLIVLLFSFGLFSCNSEEVTLNDNDSNIPSNTGGMLFVIADYNYNNLFENTRKGFYDMDYIYLITADGKYRDDLEEQYIEHYHLPIYEGWTLLSPLLDQIAGYNNYDKNHVKPEYANKPLYLHLSNEDIDTLMWKSEEKQLYHNGKPINKYNAILKNVKN